MNISEFILILCKGDARIASTLLIILAIIGCQPLVPSQSPPQLDNPLGTLVVVTNTTFNAGDFVVDYPHGWRVIKLSEAFAPMQVAFAHPDEEVVITLTIVDELGEETDSTHYRQLDNGIILQAEMTGDGENYVAEILNSLRASSR